MALASCTEVPPNFITIIGINSLDARERWTRKARTQWQRISLEISLDLQQFRIQQGRSGRAADRVVRENRELPVQNSTGAQAAHRSRHSTSAVGVEAGLRAVACGDIYHRLFGRAGEMHLLGQTAK